MLFFKHVSVIRYRRRAITNNKMRLLSLPERGVATENM
jgi:hypothetical protein